jgi:hypothetical protein
MISTLQIVRHLHSCPIIIIIIILGIGFTLTPYLRFSCLSIPSAGITGVPHYAHLDLFSVLLFLLQIPI